MTGIIQFIPRHRMEELLPDVRVLGQWALLELYLKLLHLQRTRKRELEELLGTTGLLEEETAFKHVSDETTLSIWKRQAEAEKAYNDTRFEVEKLLKFIKNLEGV